MQSLLTRTTDLSDSSNRFVASFGALADKARSKFDNLGEAAKNAALDILSANLGLESDKLGESSEEGKKLKAAIDALNSEKGLNLARISGNKILSAQLSAEKERARIIKNLVAAGAEESFAKAQADAYVKSITEATKLAELEKKRKKDIKEIEKSLKAQRMRLLI